MANLRPVALNESTASDTAMVKISGHKIGVTMAVTGLLASSPHAAHIHFGADARGSLASVGQLRTTTRQGAL